MLPACDFAGALITQQNSTPPRILTAGIRPEQVFELYYYLTMIRVEMIPQIRHCLPGELRNWINSDR
jgi:hypothetical protein